jgi:transcriptional regulator GlxA family with amidase domain
VNPASISGFAGAPSGSLSNIERALSHWAYRDLLEHFGAIPDAARVVRDGNVISGGGVTAGIDFAFTLAAELTDITTAQAVQLGLEYAPAPPFEAGRPDIAPPDVLKRVQERFAVRREALRSIVKSAAVH